MIYEKSLFKEGVNANSILNLRFNFFGNNVYNFISLLYLNIIFYKEVFNFKLDDRSVFPSFVKREFNASLPYVFIRTTGWFDYNSKFGNNNIFLGTKNFSFMDVLNNFSLLNHVYSRYDVHFIGYNKNYNHFSVIKKLLLLYELGLFYIIS